jgi:PAS domain S-box-containing protein
MSPMSVRVTDHSEAEALRLSSEVLRHVSEGVHLVRASDGVIVFTNPQCDEMFGYAPEEMVGQHISIVNAPTDKSPEETAQEIMAALDASGRWEGEIYNRRKDGTPIWCHASVSTFTHAEFGTVWVSVHRDITERKRLQEQLLRTTTFLDSIVENIPNMVFVKDAKSLAFVLFNRAGEDLLGHRRADLIGKNDYDFFPKDEADFFTEKDRAVLDDKTLLDIPEEPIETARHGPRILHTQKIPILDGAGKPAYLLGISEDITDRKHVEQLRRRHEADTAAINDILRALNKHVDLKAAFADVCTGLQELARCASASLALFDERREWLSFVAADAPWIPAASPDTRLRTSEFPAGTDALARHPHVVRDLATELHFPIGQVVHALGFRSTLSLPLCTEGGVVGILNLLWREVDGCTAGDMGALTQVANAVAIAVEKSRLFEQVRVGHERLAALSRRLLAVQETERRHLARELHDEIGQYLTGISLLLDQLKRRPQDSPLAPLGEVHELVNDLIRRVRELSLDLRPAMLDDFGLLPAFLWLFERFTRQTNITIDFQHSGLDRRFPHDVETAAYRIVQEALTNVARHAGVSEAHVSASTTDHRLRVVIADQGKGFNVDTELASGTTSGLSGMRERAALLGGRLSIESGPGAGTRVCADFEGC